MLLNIRRRSFQYTEKPPIWFNNHKIINHILCGIKLCVIVLYFHISNYPTRNLGYYEWNVKSMNLHLIPIKMFKVFFRNKIFLYIKGFKIRLSGQRFKLEFTTFYQLSLGSFCSFIRDFINSFSPKTKIQDQHQTSKGISSLQFTNLNWMKFNII